MTTTSAPPPTMPWGRWRGQPLATIDGRYLGWVSRLPDITDALRSAVTAELVRRREAARQRASVQRRRVDDPRQGDLFQQEEATTV